MQYDDKITEIIETVKNISCFHDKFVWRVKKKLSLWWWCGYFPFISTSTTSISFIRTIIHCGTISSRSNPSTLSPWPRQSAIHYPAERKYMAGYSSFYFVLFCFIQMKKRWRYIRLAGLLLRAVGPNVPHLWFPPNTNRYVRTVHLTVSSLHQLSTTWKISFNPTFNV